MNVTPMRPEHRKAARAMLEALFGEKVARPEDEGDILIALEGDRAVGLIALEIRPWADGCLTAPVAYVEAWYVEPEYRRRGVGAALMRAAERWARERGMTEIGSDAVLDNHVSLAAHARLGWQEAGRVQHFRRDLAEAGPVFVAPPDYDFAALHDLILRCFAYMEARINPPSSMLQTSAADLAALEVMLVIEAGGRPVACMAAMARGDCLYVGRLAVEEQFRGQGLSRRLMQAAEALARTRGLPEIELGSRVELTENHALFARMGFRKVREQRHDGYDRATSYWFRKRVTP